MLKNAFLLEHFLAFGGRVHHAAFAAVPKPVFAYFVAFGVNEFGACLHARGVRHEQFAIEVLICTSEAGFAADTGTTETVVRAQFLASWDIDVIVGAGAVAGKAGIHFAFPCCRLHDAALCLAAEPVVTRGILCTRVRTRVVVHSFDSFVISPLARRSRLLFYTSGRKGDSWRRGGYCPTTCAVAEEN